MDKLLSPSPVTEMSSSVLFFSSVVVVRFIYSTIIISVQGAKLPMSIIIVGVGQAEFDGAYLNFFNHCMIAIVKYSSNYKRQTHLR